MTDNTNNFSPDEQLKFIQEMIEKTRRDSADNGGALILWGWALIIASLAHYGFMALELYTLMWLPWTLMVAIATTINVLSVKKNKKEKRVRTFAEKMIGWVWIACGGAMFIVGFIAVPTGLLSGWEAISPMNCIFAWIGTLLTAKIIDWKFMFYSSFFWLVAIGAMIVVNPAYHTLIMALAIIPAYLIPGYKLRRQYKNA